MKQLVCEMCASTNLIKSDGVFVCQSCGCKYSVEEAKKMMIEGTVVIDHSPQVQNYLDLSKNAYESGNGQSAFDYANKVLEIDPQNVRAWICKMHAIEFIATFGNLKLMEVVEAGKNAIANASEDEKADVEKEVYHYELTRALDLLKIAMNKLNDTADIKRTYQSLLMISLLSASSNAVKADSGVVNLYDNLASEALAMIELIPDEVLAKNIELVQLLQECRKQYQYESDALERRFKVYGAVLTATAVSLRKNNFKKLDDKIARTKARAQEYEIKVAAIRKEEAEKKQAEKNRIYWETHVEEKANLDAEKQMWKDKLDSIKGQYDEVMEKRKEVDSLKRLRDQKLSEEAECDEQKAYIDNLKSRLVEFGFFQGKEKKKLQEKIDLEQTKLDKMKEVARSAKSKHQDEINLRIMEIQRSGQDIVNEYTSISNKIKEIENELNRPR